MDTNVCSRLRVAEQDCVAYKRYLELTPLTRITRRLPRI